MIKNIFLFVFLSQIILFADVSTSKPFSCNDQAFIGIDKYNNDKTYMSDISVYNNKVTVNAPFKKIQNTTDAIYSFGYNPKDNYIWGYNNATYKIEKVDANYRVVASYNISNLPKDNYAGADVDKNGILYLYQSKHSNKLQRIDLNYIPPKKLTPITLNKAFSTSDIAINPVDDKIYYIPHDTSEVWYVDIQGTHGTLHKIEDDLFRFVKPSKRDSGIWANATFFDAEGSMYVNSYRKHPGFYLYKIDIRDKKVVDAKRLDDKIQDDLYQADGARCALAPGMPSSGHKIEGYIFNDKNHNGIKDSGEGSLTKNSYVKLCKNGNFIKSVKVNKNSDGSYLFKNIKDGSYTLIEDASNTKDCTTQKDLKGWISTTTNKINISLSQDMQNQNFGNFNGSKISGKVFDDADKDGHLDSGEKGIANIHLVIKKCGHEQFDSTTTDSKGNYTFWVPVGVQGDNSVDGWIAVFETDPTGYISTGDEFDNGNGNQNESGDAQDDDNWLCFSNRGVDFDDGGYVLTGNNFADAKKQKTFTCSEDAYLFNGYPNSDAYTIDLSSGNYKLQKSSIPNRINATGYNIKDNYIWGYDLDAHKILKIDADYKITSYKVSNLPDLKYYAGDVSKDGILYLKASHNSKVYKIDLNSGNPKYDGYINISNTTLEFGDFAFNPKDNNLYSISTTDSHLYKIDSSNGNITDLGKQNISKDEVKHFHTFVFDKNSNLYFYGTSGKIYKIDLSRSAPYTTTLFSITNIKKEGGDGARCPNAEVTQLTEDVCYAIDPYSDYLYTANMSPGASSLPQATRKALDFSDVPAKYRKSLDGQSQAYNYQDGLIYRFREEDMYFYSIDPKTAKVHFIKKFSGLKKGIVGASFYNGYMYIIAKHYDQSTLYKIDPSDWEIISQVDVKRECGKFVDVDSLAINSNGDAYLTDFRENKTIKHLYKLNLETGIAKELFDISNPIDLEGLSFAKDDKLYISNSQAETSKDDDIISMLDLNNGSRIAANQVPKSFDAQINGLSCNVKDQDTCKISINDVNETEGDSGVKNFVFTVTFSKPAPKDAGFWVTFTDGVDAKAPIGTAGHIDSHPEDGDFGGKARYISIPEGTKKYKISVPVYGDTKVEPDEEFYVDLYAPDNLVITDDRGVGTIINDDVKFLILEPDGDKSHTDLKTKIVNKSFNIKVISVDENKNPIQNRVFDDTFIRLIPSSISCKDANSTGLTPWKKIDIYNKTTVNNFSIKSDKSNTDVKVQMKWSNGTKTECSSDDFAIRPDKFQLNLPSYKVKAGENFTFKVKALDYKSNSTLGYFEEKDTSFSIKTKDKKSPSCATGSLIFSTAMRFVNGEFNDNNHTRYDNIGIVDINISEIKGREFAKIDEKDTPDSMRFISSDSKTMTFIPTKFNISATLSDKIPGITFYSDKSNISSMGAVLNLNLSAVDSSGNVLTNYTNGCYSQDTNLTIFFSNTNTKDTQKILSNVPVLSSSSTQFILDINKSKYSNGVLNQNILINLDRNNTISKNPSLFSISKLIVNDSSISSSKNLSTSNKAHFYYGRAHAPSPQSTDQDILYAKVYYEVYCKSCDKTIFTQAGGASSEDSIYWYILPSSTLSSLGTSICNYTNPRVIDPTNTSYINHNSFDKIKIKASKVPSKNKIFYTPIKSYLRYHKFGTALPEHYFTVIFSTKNSTWAGEGSIGAKVDTKISKKENKSLDW